MDDVLQGLYVIVIVPRCDFFVPFWGPSRGATWWLNKRHPSLVYLTWLVGRCKARHVQFLFLEHSLYLGGVCWNRSGTARDA